MQDQFEEIVLRQPPLNYEAVLAEAGLDQPPYQMNSGLNSNHHIEANQSTDHVQLYQSQGPTPSDNQANLITPPHHQDRTSSSSSEQAEPNDTSFQDQSEAQSIHYLNVSSTNENSSTPHNNYQQLFVGENRDESIQHIQSFGMGQEDQDATAGNCDESLNIQILQDSSPMLKELESPDVAKFDLKDANKKTRVIKRNESRKQWNQTGRSNLGKTDRWNQLYEYGSQKLRDSSQ